MFRHYLPFILFISLSFGVFLSPGEGVELGDGYSVTLKSVAGNYGIFDVLSGGETISSPAVKTGRTYTVEDNGYGISICVSEVDNEQTDAEISLHESEESASLQAICDGEAVTAGDSLSADCYSITLESVIGGYARFSVYKDDSLFASPVIKHGRSWSKNDGGDAVTISLCPNPSCDDCVVLKEYSAPSCTSETSGETAADSRSSSEKSRKSKSGSGKSGKGKKSSKAASIPHFDNGTVLRKGNFLELDERYSLKVVNFAYGNAVQLAVMDGENTLQYKYISFNSTERIDLGNHVLEISSDGGDVSGGWVHLVAGKIEADENDCTGFINGEKVDIGNGYALSLSSFIGPYAYFTLSINGFSFDTLAVSSEKPFSMILGKNQLDISVCSIDRESKSAKAVASLSG